MIIKPTPIDRDDEAASGGTVDIVGCGQRGGVPVAMLRKRQPNEWTDRDQLCFLEHLAATANVARSARAAGKSKISAYRRRRRSIAFRRLWAEALAEGYAQLEATLLDRAINGKRVTKVLASGERVARIEHSNQLGMQLLTLHRRTVAEYEATIKPKREDPRVARARMAKLIATLVSGMEDRPALDGAPPAPPAPALPQPDVAP